MKNEPVKLAIDKRDKIIFEALEISWLLLGKSNLIMEGFIPVLQVFSKQYPTFIKSEEHILN